MTTTAVLHNALSTDGGGRWMAVQLDGPSVALYCALPNHRGYAPVRDRELVAPIINNVPPEEAAADNIATCTAWSFDGRLLAVGFGRHLTVYDTQADFAIIGYALLPFSAQDVSVACLTDQWYLLAASGSPGVQIFSLIPPALQADEFLEQDNVCVCALSRTGGVLVTISLNGNLAVWRIDRGDTLSYTCTWTTKLQGERPIAASFSPVGDRLAVTMWSGDMFVFFERFDVSGAWEEVTPSALQDQPDGSIKPLPAPLLCWESSGQQLCHISTSSTITIFDFVSGRKLTLTLGHLSGRIKGLVALPRDRAWAHCLAITQDLVFVEICWSVSMEPTHVRPVCFVAGSGSYIARLKIPDGFLTTHQGEITLPPATISRFVGGLSTERLLRCWMGDSSHKSPAIFARSAQRNDEDEEPVLEVTSSKLAVAPNGSVALLLPRLVLVKPQQDSSSWLTHTLLDVTSPDSTISFASPRLLVVTYKPPHGVLVLQVSSTALDPLQ